MVAEFPRMRSSAIVGYMSTTNMDDPCDICGDKGVTEDIITCCDCKISRQHLYCMRVLTPEVPQFWLCEECERKKLFPPKASDLSKRKYNYRKH